MSYSIFDALAELLPNVQWQMSDNDLTTFKILDDSTLPIPTQKEIEDCLTKLQQDYEAIEAEKTNKKLQLLQRLGITEDEAKLLLH